MIKFINKSIYVSDKEINSFLNLLHPKYRNLNIIVNFYDSELFKPKNISNETFGEFIIATKEINIYTFNSKKVHSQIDMLKLHILITLAHEIRHLYQSIYAPKKFTKSLINYNLQKKNSQWCERDANKFLKAISNKYKQEINEIVNLKPINYNWFIKA